MEHWREMGYKLLFQTSPQVLHKTGNPILSKNKTDAMVAKCDVVFNFPIFDAFEASWSLDSGITLYKTFSTSTCVF